MACFEQNVGRIIALYCTPPIGWANNEHHAWLKHTHPTGEAPTHPLDSRFHGNDNYYAIVLLICDV
jgi:hypothetical protein